MADIIDELEKGIVTRIVKKYEKASKEEFQEIVKKYKSEVPLYKRAVNRLVNSLSEEYITYVLARDTLSGKFSYEKFNKWCTEKINREEEADEYNERITLEIRVRDENIAKGKKVELFLGSLAEYEQMKGKKYEIMNTDTQLKYADYNSDALTLENLGKCGVEALVRFQLCVYGNGQYGSTRTRSDEGYGIPVREKKEK